MCRRLNELVKRARLAKVHAYIIGHLKNEMPALFGKDSKQQELIDNLAMEFKKVHKNGRLPAGDFPDLERFRENLKLYDFSKFPKLNNKLLENLDEVLMVDFPRLMQQFPMEVRPKATELELNPFAADEDPDFWQHYESIDSNLYVQQFQSLSPVDGKVSGAALKPVLMSTGLPMDSLSKLWKLCDIDKDGKMDLDEFALCMHLVDTMRTKGIPMPDILPPTIIPPAKRPHL
jgi:EH domain-containing protein 1